MENKYTEKTVIPLTPQKTIADRVSNQLKADIISGKLAQGAKIIEEDLATEYGVSRGPLREAIHRLEGMKLVVRIPHAGARVVTLDYQMMSDVYSVREALEGMSARLAAKYMTAKQVDGLWKLLAQHKQSVEASQGKTYIQHEGDLDFHYAIAKGSKNQWLMDHLGSELYQLIRMCRYRSGRLPARPGIALAEHQHIIEAISRQDEELAEMLMRRHISGAWDSVKELLQEK